MTFMEGAKTLHAQMHHLAAHKVGNRGHEEPIVLSESLIDLKAWEHSQTLTFHLLGGFNSDIFYRFSISEDASDQHQVFSSIKKIFADPDQLLVESRQLATHLYYLLAHPKIKSGDFYVAYFSNVLIEDELVHAIGLFKMESNYNFIKLAIGTSGSYLDLLEGYSLDHLDKGCLIYQSNAAQGYRVQIFDRSNQKEANFWKQDFLQLEAIPSDYHHTQNLLNLTHAYVSQQLPVEFEVEKVDQGEMLMRSMDYFKHHEEFNEESFANEIFEDLDVSNSFQKYKQKYMEESDHSPDPASFTIHPAAVKQQARNFKSVLKLDRNFHIYIHGDRSLIEKGADSDGRKFYKVYYIEER